MRQGRPFAPPPSGGDWATTFMAAMASECESRGTDLEATFLRIAVQSIQRTRLLNF